MSIIEGYQSKTELLILTIQLFLHSTTDIGKLRPKDLSELWTRPQM